MTITQPPVRDTSWPSGVRMLERLMRRPQTEGPAQDSFVRRGTVAHAGLSAPPIPVPRGPYGGGEAQGPVASPDSRPTIGASPVPPPASPRGPVANPDGRQATAPVAGPVSREPGTSAPIGQPAASPIARPR